MSKYIGQEKKRISTICTGPIETSKCDTKIIPTLRLNLALFESTDKIYPEFSFAELCKSETNNTDDPFASKDSLELLKVQQSVRHIEAKYNGKQSKPRKNYRDLVDLGEGYLEDSFIDNSEAYDEVVPSSLDTKYGGFYINCGKLDFVKNLTVEEEELLESREIRDEDLEDVNVVKKRKLAFVENSFKKYKKIKLEKEFRKKKINISNDLDNKSQRKKIKLKKSKSNEINNTKCTKQLEKVLQNNSDCLPKKCNFSEFKNDISKKTVSIHETKNGIISRTTAEEKVSINGFTEKDISFSINDDSIQPIVILNSDLPGDTIDGAKVKDYIHDKPLEPLPTNLNIYVNEFKELINRLPCLDVTTSQFKLPDEILLKFDDIEKSLPGSVSEMDRGILFMHLAKLINTNPTIILKRLRKLRISLTNTKILQPKELLKKAIDEAMPKFLQRYQEELAEQQQGRLRLEQMRRDSPRVEEGVESDEKNEIEKPKRIQAPRKKFQWNVLMRTLLNEIVKAKMEFFELAKIRSQTAEEYLSKYLDDDIKPLFPSGWITTRILLKESRQAHKKWTEELIKLKKSSVNNNSSVKIIETSNKNLIDVQPQINKSETKNNDPINKGIKVDEHHPTENKIIDNYKLNYEISDLPLNISSKSLHNNNNQPSLSTQIPLDSTNAIKSLSSSLNLINSCSITQPITSVISFNSNKNTNSLITSCNISKNNTIPFSNEMSNNLANTTSDQYLSEKMEIDQNMIGIFAMDIVNSPICAIKNATNNFKTNDANKIVSSIEQIVTTICSHIPKNEKNSLPDNNSEFFTKSNLLTASIKDSPIKDYNSALILQQNLSKSQQIDSKNISNSIMEITNNLKDINSQIQKPFDFSKGNNENIKDVNKFIFDEAKLRKLRQPIDEKNLFIQNKEIDLEFKKPAYSQHLQNQLKPNSIQNFKPAPSETYINAQINQYASPSDKSNLNLDYINNIDRPSPSKNLDTQIKNNNLKKINELKHQISPRTDINISNSLTYISSVYQQTPQNPTKNALKNHEISTLNTMPSPYTKNYSLSEKQLSKSKSNTDITETQLLEFEKFESEYGTKFAQGFFGQSAANMMPHQTKFPDFKNTPKLSPQVKNKNATKTVSPSNSFNYSDHWKPPSTMQYNLDNELLMTSNIDAQKYWTNSQIFSQPSIGPRGNFMSGSSIMQNSIPTPMNAFTNDPAEFIASFLHPDQFNEQFRNPNQRNQHFNHNQSMSSQASKKY